MEKSNSLDSTIVRGPRACSSAEDDSFVNTYERSTPQKPLNSATLTKESDLYSVQVSDFEMVCVLGIGSRAKVLLAQHKGSPHSYALKVIAKRRVLASQEVQRTLTEQSVLRRMAIDGANPFVAKLWRSFHDEDNLYLAMVRLAYMYIRLLLNFRVDMSLSRIFTLVATFGRSWTAAARFALTAPASTPQKSLRVLKACMQRVSFIVTSSRNTFLLIRAAT